MTVITLKPKVSRGISLLDRPRVIGRMTYARFLRTEIPRTEWVDGEVIQRPAVTDMHSDLTIWLLTVVRNYVDALRLGKVLGDPYNMKTGESLPGRAPDLIFIAEGNRRRIKPMHLAGPADLVVEVISKGTGRIDRGAKFKEYQEGGVREYWIVDPLKKMADFYQRERKGVFVKVSVAGDHRYQSAMIKGLWLDVNWLWQKPLPSPLNIAKQWRLV